MTRMTEAQALAHQARVTGAAPSAARPRSSEKPSPSRSKYKNRVCYYGGLKFGSQIELARWKELQVQQCVGLISGLQHQPKFDLLVNGHLVCRYIADSKYTRDCHDCVEDVKSPSTRKNRAYRIKLKLMRACHGIEIAEYMESSTPTVTKIRTTRSRSSRQ